ncbi:14-3-3 protein [Penicillium pulvis]|uniref:14-3-3 protein n=1 Tax=Penicillium pulvis TaxID=1562058 RepID=UPI002546F712|nr:14-3-3 protein [Penicillium pulvis]KAJ5792633.1 14-3-3 protein [Penicillium pulvis]
MYYSDTEKNWKMAEQDERYDLFLDMMSENAREVELNFMENYYLARAYKNVTNDLKAKAKATSDERKRTHIQMEFMEKWRDMIMLLTDHLFKSAKSNEANVLYQMIHSAGNTHGYIAGFIKEEPDARGEFPEEWGTVEKAQSYYDEAWKLAKPMPLTHPFRLGLDLDYSIFLHDVVGSPDKAISWAKAAMKNTDVEDKSFLNEHLATTDEQVPQSEARFNARPDAIHQLWEQIVMWEPTYSRKSQT